MKLISLKEASENLPYSADYLSLLVRKKKIFGKKLDGKWMTTQAAVDEYVQKIAEASYAHQKDLNVKIPSVEKTKALINLKWILILVIIVIVGWIAWELDLRKGNNSDNDFIIQKDVNNNLTIQVDDPSAIGSVTIVPKK